MQLAESACRLDTATAVENEVPTAGERLADRYVRGDTVLRFRRMESSERRALGRPVSVGQTLGPGGCVHFPDEGGVHGLASNGKVRDGGYRSRVMIDAAVELC